MCNRRLSISILLLGLLLSSWGGVLAAALCPHMAQDYSCCLMSMAHEHDRVSPHHSTEMAGMGDMEMMPQTSAANEVTNSLDQPVESCAHCMGRSEPPFAPVVTASAIEQSKSVADAALAPASNAIAASTQELSASLTRSTSNAPPGASTPRHILISCFRI
jgi:hypothetical protein